MTPLRTATRASMVAMFATALAIVSGLFGSVPAAHADDAPDAAVSWSVSPADETGEDGRHAIENEVDPGESVQEHIIVRNLGAEDVVFALSAADGFYTEAGRFDMLPSGRESTDAGAWITIGDDVTIPAGGAVVVPFTITVPSNAEPGDHAAGVAASVLSVRETGADGTGVGVESRVGVKVITRVTGEIVPAFAVGSVTTDYDLSWNPFEAGSATVTFDVENTGNARLDAAGEVRLGGAIVPFPAEGTRPQVLLPGEKRSFTVTVPDVWPLFAATGELAVDPTAATSDGSELAVTGSRLSLFTWAIPWPHLALLVGIVLIVLALRGSRVRSRRRMNAAISEAEARGRDQALIGAGQERVAG
ncbi:hypothetical protein [Microbacterium gorillae]|uniref:hypothetical protein n=1 Tax=Microbacterium gorillae TaxID=1231063 RepID=UPI003D994046